MDFESFNDMVNGILDPIVAVPYVRPTLILFLSLFGGLASPAFAIQYKPYFDNIFVRIVMLAFIIWIVNKDPGLALGVATVFIVVLNMSNGKGPFERFEGPATAIYPGCMNMKVYDLLESFNNDKDKLMNAMLASRIPGDVTVTDYYAPLIATYLLNVFLTLI
jgi:hypothetical protein